MTDAVETIETDGYVGRIFYDESPSNPREEFDQLAVLTQLRTSEQPDDNHDDRIIEAWERTVPHRWHGYSLRHVIYDTELIERYARAFLDAAAVGWLDDPRSSSRIFGYVTREACASAGITDAQAALDAELAEYGAWCEGEVFGYTVTDPDGNEIDSCWGYYGDDELPYVRERIAEAIEDDKAARHEANAAMYRRLASS